MNEAQLEEGEFQALQVLEIAPPLELQSAAVVSQMESLKQIPKKKGPKKIPTGPSFNNEPSKQTSTSQTSDSLVQVPKERDGVRSYNFIIIFGCSFSG